MTVRRHAEEFFYATPAEVASAVRALLARHPPYSRIHEPVKETEFRTTINASISFIFGAIAFIPCQFFWLMGAAF
jgi:hypothetical protein